MGKCKDRLDVKDQRGVIYSLSCMDCNLKYIGETGRTARTCTKKHLADFQNCHPEKSAAAEHEWKGHSKNWAPELLAIERGTHEWKVKEAEAIHQHSRKGNGVLNCDDGLELSKLWPSLF